MAGAGWNVLTNPWGSSKLRPGIDYTLDADFNSSDYVDGTVLSWKYGPVPNTPWPVVLAFPEVMFGPSPKGDLYNQADTTHSLPVQVKDIGSFTSNYNLSYGGNRAGFNVAYDLFFTSKPNGDSSTVTNELMIWLSQGGIATYGTNLGYYSDGTFSGDLFYNAASHYIAFVSRTDMTSGTVDIGAMIKTLEKLGIMSGDEYYETFQLGSEVIGGQGYLRINSLDADIVTNGINGPAQEKLIQGTGAVVTAAPAGGATTTAGVFDLAPTSLAISGNWLKERQAGGTAAGTVNAVDPEGQALSYSLVDNAGGRFAIDGKTGALTSTQTLYYADATTYKLVVRVTDAGGAYADGTFWIAIGKVNQPPANLMLSNASVVENAAVGTVVGTASATDPDGPASALTYSLVTSMGAFAIDARTGVVTTTSPYLNYESRSSYTITVRATDSQGAYVDRSFDIGLVDVNEAPTKMVLSNNRVTEEQAAGTVIGTATATDPDKGDVVTYSLADNAGGVFRIDAATGVLTTSAPLGYDAKRSYSIVVRATDTVGNIYDKAYSVAVDKADPTATGLVRNQAPTDFDVAMKTFTDTVPAGTTVGTAHAVDPEGTALTYSLLDSPGFAIDPTSGAITATSALTGAHYDLTVQVTDATGLSSNKDVSLAVTLRSLIAGGAGNDRLTGTSGNDVIDGGKGADVMTGGDGDDSYYVDNPGDTVVETWNNGAGGIDTINSSITYTLPYNVENLTLIGSADIDGTGGMNNNVITGNSGDNVLSGLDGYDTLYGGGGNDTLYGGDKNDWLYGGSGNDILDGGTGADIMSGGDGDDTYYVDNPGDQVLELYNNGLGGTDTIYSSVSYTMPGSVENITLTGTADIDATGGVNNNVLTGNSGDNVLTGGGGWDTLIGGAGTDTAWYAGKSTGYQIQTLYGRLQVTDIDPSDGNDNVDLLSQIEKLYFAGDGVTLSVASPIVLDLAGKGVSLVSESQSGARFDMDGDGVADRTAWFGQGSALLFLDRNGDGTLSDAGEMSFTDDKAGARSDLDGLGSFDTNHDGVLSAADSQFGSFKLFVDGNGDGQVEAGEVKSLADLGIASITLAGTAVNATWQAGQAMVLNTGSFTYADGRTGAFDDVALSYQASGVRQAAQAFAEATSAFSAAAAADTTSIDPSQRRDGLLTLAAPARLM